MPSIEYVTKADKVMHYVGFCGIMIAAFCWGWNKHLFELKRKG